MKGFRGLFAFAVLLLMLFSSHARALEPVTIQLKWLHQFQFAGYYAALEKGFYREEGLEVTLRERDPATEPVEDVLEGRADYGVTDSGLVLAALRDQPVVLVSQIFQRSPLVLLTREDSGIDSAEKLFGKRVMTDVLGITNTPILVMLNEALGGIGKVDLQPHSFRNDDLIEGVTDAIAAYSTSQPFYFEQKGVGVNVIDPHDYGIDFYGDNLFTTQEEVSQHPQRVERVRRATLKGWRYARQNPDEIIDLVLEKYTSAHPRPNLEFQARETLRLLGGQFHELGSYERERFQRFAEVYANLGLAERSELDDSFFYLPRAFGLTSEEVAYLDSLGPIEVPLIRYQPPLSFVRSERPAGYLNELLNFLVASLGLEVTRPDMDFATSISALAAGEVDLSNDYSGDQGREGILSTAPVLTVPFVAVGRRNASPVRSVSDLRNRRIVAVAGFQQTRALQANYPGIELQLVSGIDDAYRALRSDDADLYIDNATHAGYRLRGGMVSDLRIAGELPEEELGVLRLRFAVSSNHPLLHSAVEKVLEAIPSDVMQRMRDKWLHIQANTSLPLVLSSNEREWLDRHPVIRVALDPAWAPVEYRDDQGVYRGISMDYLGRLESTLGVKFEVAEGLTWQEGVKAVRERDADMFASVSITPERQMFVDFTEPYVHLPIRVFARDDVSYIGGLANLVGRRVAVVRGYAIEEWLKRDHPELQLVSVATPLEGLEAVSDGRVEAFAGNVVSASYYLGKAKIDNVRIAGDTGYTNSQAMGVRKDWPILVNILQKALDSVSQAEHDRIFNSWMSLQFEQKVDYRLLVQVALLSMLVLLVVLYWNRRLAKEVLIRKGAESALLEHKALLAQRVDERTAELREMNRALTVEVGERQQAEEKLREAAAVFSNTAEGVAITDLQGAIRDVNEAFTRITGYSKAEVLGKNPNILSSDRQDESFYRVMWNSLSSTGHWRGEIWNRRKDGSLYPQLLTISVVPDEQGEPSGYVGVFADISALKESEAHMAHLAHHDALTGLANRLLFDDRLSQSVLRAERNGEALALVFIDLDRFKHINDSFGHKAGDRLLVELADRLKQLVRAEDTVARISGDEFVVLLQNIGDAEDAEVAVKKLMRAFETPISTDGELLHVTASMGVSLFPGDGGTGETLLLNADSAMYQAKDDGRNTYHFYRQEMSARIMEQVFYENALRTALDEQQFYLVYQPQVDLASSRIVGVEALLRWNHPERGNIPPDKFIPVAERSGRIREIGAWVLREACRQAREWLNAEVAFGHVAVNVAGPQLHGGNFLALVREVLHENELPPQVLEMEITESYAMGRAESDIEQLRGLQQLGVGIAIDDFGTGYSSLGHLKRLPVDKLKIDKCFVQDIPEDQNDMAICESIVSMSRALQLSVIAEGVETAEQVEFLQTVRCDVAQGYFYSRPISADDLAQSLVAKPQHKKDNSLMNA